MRVEIHIEAEVNEHKWTTDTTIKVWRIMKKLIATIPAKDTAFRYDVTDAPKEQPDEAE